MKSQALLTAIERAGGVGALGKKLGISGPAVSQWRNVPPHRVIAVEALTGVSRIDLRPDLYPSEGSANG